MEQDIFNKCMRLDVKDSEFDDVPTRHFTEDLEKDTEIDSLEFNSDLEFDAPEDDEIEVDDEVPVIDTDLKKDEEGDVTANDYVGKYVVVCPICFNPLFSDHDHGEVHCPICDVDVEIEEAAGKIVDAEAEVEAPKDAEETTTTEDDVESDLDFDDEGAEFSVDDEETTEKEVTEESLDKSKVNESKLNESDLPAPESIEDCQKWIDYDMETYGHVSEETKDIINKAGFQIIKDDHGDYEVAAKKYESLGDAAQDWYGWDDPDMSRDDFDSDEDYNNALLFDKLLKKYDAYGKYEIQELVDNIMTKEDQLKIKDIIKYKSENEELNKSDKDDKKLDENVNVNICPEGSVTVTSDEADATIAIAPKAEPEQVDTELTTTVDVNDNAEYTDENGEGEVVDDIEDFDTEAFDSQVTDTFTDIYADENLKYESTKVKLDKANNIVVEGVIRSGKLSKNVKFMCNQSESKLGSFKLEGISNLEGQLNTKCIYDKSNKSLKVESMNYKFIDKESGNVYEK